MTYNNMEMKNFKHIAAAAILTATAFCANAGNLWVIGEATSYGWSTDDATSLVSTPADEAVYTGTLYLKAGLDFKFMTVPDFGNEELGAAPGATLADGKVALAKGKDDTGYDKLRVAENGNYLITVDTQNMTAEIVKSVYQESEIKLSSLYMVGSATPNGWDVMKGTPLYQNPQKPYEFSTSDVEFTVGSFKIATVLKGACSWNGAYWYFRDAADANRIALNQDGDIQWEIAEAGKYDVKVNIGDNSISIAKSKQDGVESIVADDNAGAEYFNLLGVKVENPSSGIYICRRGSKTSKVMIR